MADDIRTSIEIDTSTAQRNVDDLAAKTENLDTKIAAVDGTKVDVPIDAPGAVDTAAQLDNVDQAARRAGSGARVGTQAVSDLTGPLGDASSNASEMGQAVEGLGQFVEAAAGKMGLSEEAAAGLSAGLGVAAIAVAAGAALWSLWKEKSEEARRAAEKMADVQRDLADGKFAEAASKLVEQYGDLFESANTAGIGSATLTRALLGNKTAADDVATALQSDRGEFIGVATQAEVLAGKIDDAGSAFRSAGEKIDVTKNRTDEIERVLRDAGGAADDTATSVGNLKDKFDQLNGSIDVKQTALDVADAFDAVVQKAREAATAAETGGADTVTANRASERSVLDLKQKVIDYAEQVGNLPADKVTNILTLLDQGDLERAQAAIADLTKTATKIINVQVQQETDRETRRAANVSSQPLIVNNFPPSITPLSVERAQQRTAQIQGPF
jgi:hypothetical protein